MSLTNWARNLTYSTNRCHTPTSLEELSEIVRKSSKVRALGTRHSFSEVADTDGEFISTSALQQIGGVNRREQSVEVGPGVTYAALCSALEVQGYTVASLASLPHISVAGACATATHGSGDRNGNLATAVRAIQLITASGEMVEFRRGRDTGFKGAVVSLGALGVVVRLTLDVVPLFKMKQFVYEGLELATLEEHFDEIFSSAYSVSLFTDWKSDRINQIWRKGPTDMIAEPEFFGATLASQPLHPVPGMPSEFCSPQMSKEAFSHSILPHFRIEFTPSSGEELQTEYIVPRENAVQALREVFKLRELIAPLLHISEIRTIASDNLWLSPCYRRHGCGIHFTWKKDWHRVQQVLPMIEQALAPFEPRPHWGKLFTMPWSEVASRYERLNDFKQLAQRLDPEEKFANRFIDRLLSA